MYTIRELALRHRLSRSALLYYDEIDLLPPSARTAANYRLYDQSAAERLERICDYRQAGLSLERIKELLSDPPSRVTRALNARLTEINREIKDLRQQQAKIVSMLKSSSRFRATRYMDKERWVELMGASGLSEDDMRRWHQTFEAASPEAHQDFLESIGIPADEIVSIRNASRETGFEKRQEPC
ncbi:MerR family transcriptional regulator [Pelagicoccus sp. SDUM812003]|uniref:MerR family transcriptional regulator n=1 Tax=Pelagicoccus sp. SDUM812003 TaxID=3041267 RepID=UPI0028109B24|nr:MerR family transcriptional regulator [Pelagicoccus sp. SDUM812003]MDQ8201784.1 MerR family transcriptional regulator [Pelagicoccus sp. SDUM812003]